MTKKQIEEINFKKLVLRSLKELSYNQYHGTFKMNPSDTVRDIDNFLKDLKNDNVPAKREFSGNCKDS